MKVEKENDEGGGAQTPPSNKFVVTQPSFQLRLIAYYTSTPNNTPTYQCFQKYCLVIYNVNHNTPQYNVSYSSKLFAGPKKYPLYEMRFLPICLFELCQRWWTAGKSILSKSRFTFFLHIQFNLIFEVPIHYNNPFHK